LQLDSLEGTKMPCRASGYHSPAVLHKDDRRTDRRERRIATGA